MGSQMYNKRHQNHGTYIEGNTVRKFSQYGQTVPQEIPERRYAEPVKKQQVQRRQKERPNASAHRHARNKALSMSLGYVGFLSVAAVSSLFICVNFLRLQAEATQARKTVASMESQYSELKLSNDAAYSKAVSNVDLEEIRNIAINELGMVYANKGQIVTYEKPDKDYVRQYGEVPKE